MGYVASKWASERILEKASETYGIPVSIYRPTNITDDAPPSQDLVHSVVHFSRVLKAVPDPTGVWDGFINFVNLDICTDNIIDSVLHVAHARELGIRYLHVTGPEDIAGTALKSHLESGEGERTWYSQLPLTQWVARAQQAGLNELTGTYLKKLATEGQPMYLTRTLKDEGVQDLHREMKRSSSWNPLNKLRRT